MLILSSASKPRTSIQFWNTYQKLCKQFPNWILEEFCYKIIVVLTSVISSSSFSFTPSISVTPMDWLGKSSQLSVRKISSVNFVLKESCIFAFAMLYSTHLWVRELHPTLVGKICDTIALQAVERSPELFPRDLLHEIETENQKLRIREFSQNWKLQKFSFLIPNFPIIENRLLCNSIWCQ